MYHIRTLIALNIIFLILYRVVRMSLHVSQEYARLKTAERFKQFLMESGYETFTLGNIMKVFQLFLESESTFLNERSINVNELIDSKLDYISWIRGRIAQNPDSPTNQVRERTLRDFAGSDNYLR